MLCCNIVYCARQLKTDIRAEWSWAEGHPRGRESPGEAVKEAAPAGPASGCHGRTWPVAGHSHVKRNRSLDICMKYPDV